MNRINREILGLALPSILANITVPIVGMVDIAVAGHLDTSAATMIGGIAIGSMLFDLLYWNFGFLRVGTGGLTAQAFGKKDGKECVSIFTRAIGIALACALFLTAIQWGFVKAAFLVVDCTPQVRELASEYFFIRIWAAPATLSLMAFKGWFIGMQDGISPMITDLVVNIMNVVMSSALSLGFDLGFMSFKGIGFSGIAAGTVAAQYSGLLCASLITVLKYGKKYFSDFGIKDLKSAFKGSETRRFFTTNRDLFVRSLCFIGIYIGFTTISAHFGDLLLASSSILMKILMIFSYFTDGFAYSGEALTGKFIGAGDSQGLKNTVKHTFIWSMGLGLAFMVIYRFGGIPVLRMMTSDPAVIDISVQYLPWLLLMPLIGCAAFAWDGIYIGATASRTIRNAMIWATAGFFITYFLGAAAIKSAVPENSYPEYAIHCLMAAYFVHLLIRTIHLSVKYRKVILLSVQA